MSDVQRMRQRPEDEARRSQEDPPDEGPSPLLEQVRNFGAVAHEAVDALRGKDAAEELQRIDNPPGQ